MIVLAGGARSPSTVRNARPEGLRRSFCPLASVTPDPGPVEIEGVVELRLALHTKELHEAFAGLVADGKTTPRGARRKPLQLGATFWHFRHESRVTSPPVWVQNMMLPPLWALAKIFGVRPYYDRWDSRI